MIVLDSNQLRQAAPPGGPLLSLLRKVGEANGHVLAIPQMVLDEKAVLFHCWAKRACGGLWRLPPPYLPQPR
jgi:hypothetical protein